MARGRAYGAGDGGRGAGPMTARRGSGGAGRGALFAELPRTAEKKRRLDGLLFPVFYALCEREKEKTSTEKLIGPLLWIPDFFQLLAYAAQSASAWHPGAVRWIDVLGNLSSIVLGPLGSAGFLALFWLSVALVFLALADTALVAVLFRRKIYTTLWPVKALRLLTGTLVTAFFIPTLSYLLVGLQCAAGSPQLAEDLGAPLGAACLAFPLALYSAVSSLLLLPFLAFGLTVSLLYYNYSWKSGDLVAAAHGRCEFAYTAGRSLLVLVAALLPPDSPVVPLVLALVAAALSALYAIVLPFYKYRVNALRAGLLSSTSFFGLATLLLTLLPASTPEGARLGASVALLLATALAFVPGAALARWRHRRLLAVHSAAIVHAHARVSGVASFVRSMSMASIAAASRSSLQLGAASAGAPALPPPPPALNAIATTARASVAEEVGALGVSARYFWIETDVATRFLHDRKDKEGSTSGGEEAEKMERADGVFAEGARQFAAGSPFVSLARIVFLHALNAPDGEVSGEWQRFAQLKARFDHRFLAYQLRNDQAHAAAGAAAGRSGQKLNIVQMMEFQRDMRTAIRSHNEALKLLRGFYKWAASTGHRDADSAGRRLDAVDRARRRAAAVYERMLEHFPTSVPLLRHYAVFLRDIENDAGAADSFFAQADYVEEQNARAGGGGDAEASSARGSSTDGGSSVGDGSVAGRRRGAAAPRLRKNRAVQTLFWVIAGCVGVLVAEPVVFFVVSQQLFRLYDESLTDLNNAGLRRKLLMDVMFFARSAQMAASANETAAYAAATASLRRFAGDAQRIHQALYLKSAAFAWTPAVWQRPVWPALRLVSPPTQAPALAVAAATAIASGPASQFAGDWSTQHAPLRFLLDNGLYSVLASLNTVVTAFEDEIYSATFARQMILLALFLFEVLTIVALAFVALRPDAIFRRIREASVGCGEVLAKVPRRSFRRVYALYKSREYVAESEDEEEGDEQSLGGALDRRPSEVPLSMPDEEEAEEAGAGAGMDVTLARRESLEAELEGAGGRARLRARGRGRGRAGRRGSASAASSDAELAAAEEMEEEEPKGKARRRPPGRAAVAGSRVFDLDSEAGTFTDREAEAGGSVHAPAAPAALALGPDNDDDDEEEEGGAGAGRDSVVAIAIPPQGPAGAPGLILDAVRGAGADAAAAALPPLTGAPGQGTERGAGRGSFGSGASGSGAGSGPSCRPRARPAAARPGGRRPPPRAPRSGAAMRMTTRPSSTCSSPAPGASPPPRRGPGRARAGHSPCAAAAAAVHPAPPSGEDLLVRAGGGGGPKLKPEEEAGGLQHRGRSIAFSPFAQQFTVPHAAPAAPAGPRDEAAEREQRAGPGAGAGPGRGRAGILRRFAARFALAFTLVAVIALANFLTMYLAINSGKYISSEIQSGGRRRFSSRMVSFLARELVLDDGALLPRALLGPLLASTARFCRRVHEGLKFGDPAFRLPGSSLRYPPMEELLYKPGCLLLNQTACGVPNRSVEPARITQGFDSLVYFFLESAERLLQEFWYGAPGYAPPAEAVRASPCLDLLHSEACRYDGYPNRIPEAALAAPSAEPGAPLRGYHGLRARELPPGAYSAGALGARSRALAFLVESTSPAIGDFFDGTQRAINLYFQEHMDRLAAVATAQVAFLAAHLGLLAAVSLLLFRPMLLHLKRESGRLGQLLSTVPPEVATDDPFFAPYFGARDDSDDEEGEGGDEGRPPHH
eukprot:tig00021318_g20159.t1